MQLDQLQRMLTAFAATSSDAAARDEANRIEQFIATTAQPWSRDTLHGHLTASAWVLDRSRTHAAMILHRKLDRWLQPGGHIEATDSSWRAAAQREVTEEIGLHRFVDSGETDALFDVDIHPIPLRKDVPAHLHYDLRFLFVADVDARAEACNGATLALNTDEAHDCRWFGLSALANDPSLELSLRRMVELSIRRFT